MLNEHTQLIEQLIQLLEDRADVLAAHAVLDKNQPTLSLEAVRQELANHYISLDQTTD